MINRTPQLRDRGPGRGFTLVELLVVIGIIVILIGLLILGLNRAARAGQRANTAFFMNSIKQALVRFQEDHGYLPPVLGPDTSQSYEPDCMTPPFNCALNLRLPQEISGVQQDPTIQYTQQDYYSITTLPHYLLGYGDRRFDGYGLIGDPSNANEGAPAMMELPKLGFRSPGRDGAWGAVTSPRGNGVYPVGSAMSRNNVPLGNVENQNDSIVKGRVYGPYLELKDNRTIGGLAGYDGNGNPIIVESGEPGFDALPKVFLDYWGNPIHYYRVPYSGNDPSIVDSRFNLGNVFALRPYTLPPGQVVRGVDDENPLLSPDSDGIYDNYTTHALKAAQFALFTSGPDRQWIKWFRFDQEGYNEDNIVELGP